MSIYFNSFLMLVVTIAAFVLLAKLAGAMRVRGFFPSWSVAGSVRPPNSAVRLAIEQSCMIDGKRRLMLIRCDEQRVLLLTGGPADMVVCVLPERQVAGLEP